MSIPYTGVGIFLQKGIYIIQMDKAKQLTLRIWAEAIGGAIYDTMIKAAKDLEDSALQQEPYYDEE